MKILIFGLLGLAISVLLALAVKEDNGYILIGYGQWTIEGSFGLFPNHKPTDFSGCSI